MSAFLRGMMAEHNFRKLLGDKVRESSRIEDQLEHFDFSVKVDVKKVRAIDEFKESAYHYLEVRNINGQNGWLYGSSDYVAFETAYTWIICPTKALREFVKKVAIREMVKEKKPYYYYQREGRKDLMIMVPSVDLFRVEGTFSIEK